MRQASLRTALLVAVIALLALGPGVAQNEPPAEPAERAPGRDAPQPAEGPEVTPAATALLSIVRSATEQRLLSIRGLKPAVVDKIMARRKAGGGFKDLPEFARVTGIEQTDLIEALQHAQEQEGAKAWKLERKPIPDPPVAGKAQGLVQRGKAPVARPAAPGAGQPPASGEGPIGSVRAGYYAKLPGFDDLDTIDPVQKKEFLETVNRDLCTCGCQGETIAYCLVNDPGCPVVKARARKIYEDILARGRQ